jgi:hypothetical protein
MTPFEPSDELTPRGLPLINHLAGLTTTARDNLAQSPYDPLNQL